MSFAIDRTLGVHAQAIGLHIRRSEILAANLANESTPGFKARDLDFAAEMRRSAQVSDSRLMYRVPTQPAQDGNTVEASVEQAAFAKASQDYQASLTFLNQKLRGLKQAIEGR
ncbi:flagellar basal body rod protein FlgB [Pseudomonas sp. HR96]|uniref:flagellar basal body rod protein FlgB n=1 Tax=Pseudomonas sp. HR96 TaxID=1027966 RepID=UPI002A760D88|nr:flagellar basal body rod protein FlgB [Pseudomonas sp. HR96]WPP00072.1 flagellar basal body rod protein FlgB [Pseudomonas sp. HR96]